MFNCYQFNLALTALLQLNDLSNHGNIMLIWVGNSTNPLLQFNMSKQRLQLQAFLDSQLEQVEHIRAPDQLPAFDKLQQKLNLIEKKLLNLKGQSIKANHYHQKLNRSIQKTIVKKESLELISGKKNEQSRIVEVQKTPQKPFKIFSKTMSEGYFQFNPSSGVKSKNKKYDSEKKTVKDTYLASNDKNKKSGKTLKKIKEQTNHNMTSKKSINLQGSKGKLNKTAHDYHLINLQKDIQSCMKSNAQLKVKITHLQGYKAQYCRLKQVFLQCQKIRKKMRA